MAEPKQKLRPYSFDTISTNFRNTEVSWRTDSQQKVFNTLNNMRHHYPKEIKIYIHTKMCKCMFIAALFVIVKKWKQLKYLPSEGWIHKMWYICKMEYYSAEKIIKYRYMLHMDDTSHTWMKLENIMLRKRSDIVIILFIWSVQSKWLYRDRK